jgi:hypothetical protein
MTPSAAPAVPVADHPALMAEYAAWQALVTELAQPVDWLDDERDDAPPPRRGGKPAELP